ncbi:hypothetical protein GF345_00820 [Candidatus Woesearchaeota archaeon]|nr:hypothetical protein [Candidatus Woesearchaeota archaeon]
MEGGTELSEDTYDRIDQQIGSLTCSRGESVCISENNKQIERDEVAVFPVTVKNELPDELDFRVRVELARGHDRDNNMIYSSSDSNIGEHDHVLDSIKWLPDEDFFSLDPGESNTLPILVSAEKDSIPGKYSFNVYFYTRDTGTTNWQDYPDERPNKFYLTVE